MPSSGHRQVTTTSIPVTSPLHASSSEQAPLFACMRFASAALRFLLHERSEEYRFFLSRCTELANMSSSLSLSVVCG